MSSNSKTLRDGIYAAVYGGHKSLAPQVCSLLAKAKQPSNIGLVTWALGRLGHKDAIPNILPLLTHNQEEVRVWAAWALGELGNYDIERFLRQAIRSEESSQVASAIGGALKKINLESTRVYRGQILQMLKPPLSSNPLIQDIVDKLEGLEWSKDEKSILSLREQMQQLDSGFFEKYMNWVRDVPRLKSVVSNPKKVYPH